MQSNWPTKKLGEVINPQYGYTASAKDKGNFRFVRITDINEGGELKLTEKKYVSASLEEIKNYILTKEDLLVARTGSIGRMLYFDSDEPAIFASYLIRLKPDISQIFPKYLWLFSHTPSYWGQVGLSATGAVQPQFNANRIKTIKIPLPPLKIQHQIVERMDAIRKAQDLNDKQIALAEEVFQSLLRQELNPKGKNWEVEKLREVCDFYNGQAHEKYINENGNFVVINSKFIASNGMKYKKTNNALFPLLRGDITMVMSDVPKGQALAKCFFVDKNDTYTLNQRICAIRSKNFENKFLYYQLNRNRYFLRFDNGQSQTNLRKDDILDCPLLIPPLETQRQIVEKLQAVQDYKKILLEQKQKLQELFDSCLNKVMKGELVG